MSGMRTSARSGPRGEADRCGRWPHGRDGAAWRGASGPPAPRIRRIRVQGEEDTMRRSDSRSSPCVLALSVGAGTAMAQTITGLVTDNTGGILPGVTVEAASPALIEGSRIAFSDGAGRYTLIDLRPGVYTLTFSLPGFSTVVVEGQDLPADFTATVNAELSVGALEETVTVSGQAPLVDVQSTARAEVLDREILDAIPDGQHAAVDGAAHHRHQDEPPGGGADHRGAADLHVGARDEPVAGDDPGRRPEHEQHRRRRRRPELPQPPGQPGDGVRDQRDERRDLGRRGPHQHGPARGRQPAERPALVRGQPRQPAARRSR